MSEHSGNFYFSSVGLAVVAMASVVTEVVRYSVDFYNNGI